MDLINLLPTFVLAVVLISASPGPAMALILRRSALGGYRAAVPTVLGLEAGLYLWALAAAAGFAALVAASQTAFIVLKVMGAAVLLIMGIRSWRHAWRLRAGEPSTGGGDEGPGASQQSHRSLRWFGEGVIVQLANPKAAVFMIAFYPQFVPPDRNLSSRRRCSPSSRSSSRPASTWGWPPEWGRPAPGSRGAPCGDASNLSAVRFWWASGSGWPPLRSSTQPVSFPHGPGSLGGSAPGR